MFSTEARKSRTHRFPLFRIKIGKIGKCRTKHYSEMEAVRPMSMGKRSINKKFEFQRYPPELFRTHFLWARLEKKKSKLLKKPEKSKYGADVGPTSA